MTFSTEKYEVPLQVVLLCFSGCITGFVAAFISGVHILTNSHIRRNLYTGKNKCFDGRTSLMSSNYDVEAAYSYCENAKDSVNSGIAIRTESDPVPIKRLKQVNNHPTPMSRSSYLVDEFMLMFLKLARGRHARSRSLSDSGICDYSKKKVDGRCRSQTWSSDDIEKQASSADYKYKSFSSLNEHNDSIILDMEDDEMYVKVKND